MITLLQSMIVSFTQLYVKKEKSRKKDENIPRIRLQKTPGDQTVELGGGVLVDNDNRHIIKNS